jgi:ABC-type phosphate/phosphonate transport system substrate-binding protein
MAGKPRHTLSSDRHNNRWLWWTVTFMAMMLLTRFSQAGNDYNVVYYNPDISAEDSQTMVAAMKTYIDYLGRQVGASLKPFYFDKEADLEQWQRTNKTHLGIFSSLYIKKNHQIKKFDPFSIVVVDGEMTYRKVLVVRKDSPPKSLADLKGKTLISPRFVDENKTFLNELVFAAKIDLTKHFQKITSVPNANAAVMAVLNKAADAALINEGSLQIVQEFNPKIEQNLHVIFTSEKINLPGLVAFTDNVTPDFVAKIKQAVTTMHQNPEGSQALQTFSIEAWKPATLKDWVQK